VGVPTHRNKRTKNQKQNFKKFEMKNKNIFSSIFKTTVCCLFIAISAHAQYAIDLRKSADRFYADGDYYSAAKYYEQFLTNDSKREEGFKPYEIQNQTNKSNVKNVSREMVVYRLAECYRKVNDHPKAENWYKEATQFDNAQFPLSRYYYAQSLRYNSKPDSALQEFKTFISGYNQNDEFSETAKREVANCQFASEQMHKTGKQKYAVEKAGADLNTNGANYAPTYASNNLVFTSSRLDGATKFQNRLYTSPNGSGLTKLRIADNEMQQGVASFNTDGNRMYFTQWSKKAGKTTAAIYMSSKTNEAWSEPVKLNEQVNKEGFISQQPCVTNNGRRLVFSSDMLGGKGKTDLWFVSLNEAGEPSETAINMELINTPDDEQAAYYNEAAQTFVFASNGLVGMGGYDLYKTITSDFQKFTEPANLGMPFNSMRDDIYFANAPSKKMLEEGYMSSDRSSLCCLELYSIKKLKVDKMITGRVVDSKTNQPIVNAVVSVLTGEKVFKTLFTNAEGSYQFAMEDYAHVDVNTEKAQYKKGELKNYDPKNTEDETFTYPDILMTPLEMDVNTTDPNANPAFNVYFDYDKSNVRTDAKDMLDQVLVLLKADPKATLEMSGHTDGKGTDEYNDALSAKRVAACKAYLTKNGIAVERLKTSSFGKRNLAETETTDDGKDNEEGRQKNRRVQLRVVKN
jgi:OmpA-OmpF porin, OOP family